MSKKFYLNQVQKICLFLLFKAFLILGKTSLINIIGAVRDNKKTINKL